METIEDLEALLGELTTPGFRGRLLDRGEARSLMLREGVLPADAPNFGSGIETDLEDYAFAVLQASLSLRDLRGDPSLSRRGFLNAARALEDLVRNGPSDRASLGLHRVLSAAAYHLAGYSAMSYALLNGHSDHANLSESEKALADLLVRNLDQLRDAAQLWLSDPRNGDDALRARIEDEVTGIHDAVSHVITAAFFKAMAHFEFALQTGDRSLVDTARTLLQTGLDLAASGSAVHQWWVCRVALHVIDGLWENSLHVNIPQEGAGMDGGYALLRSRFIGQLFSRRVSEVELWPSQVEAAQRAAASNDSLVVALPTSAGKTRIAEIAALATLARGKRVLVVTPLRALSAQSERIFRKTFGRLGFGVSALYGSAGLGRGDRDELRSTDIVIATPEKLDFGLRSDPAVLDDVGLIVLDEGHQIGAGEREIRFEVLVQRILRRPDAAERRILCLSAVLPDGDQLRDLSTWITGNANEGAVRGDWRPTRQRFGMLAMGSNAARLQLGLEDDAPFLSRFVVPRTPPRPLRAPFPNPRNQSNRDLTLAAAWEFASQGRRVMVFLTQRDHVEKYANAIVERHRQGLLPDLSTVQGELGSVHAVGAEWLGTDHPVVQCLGIGVGIHHARLPKPYLREVERLMANGNLPVMVSSPTLAQGLNARASVLLVPTLYRSGKPISPSQLANVAGRVGRAYSDVEGLIVFVDNQRGQSRRRLWKRLARATRGVNLVSGILQAVEQVLQRLAASGSLSRDDAFEYLANSREAWTMPTLNTNSPTSEVLLDWLDTVLLGLVEALDADSSQLPFLVDDALSSSLWERQLARYGSGDRDQHVRLLTARARCIWRYSSSNQRQAFFAMGVGLESGIGLDDVSDELGQLVAAADEAARAGDADSLVDSLAQFTTIALAIRPFAPEGGLEDGWQGVLDAWLRGTPLADIGPDAAHLVEDAFAYRLVWALEAVRTRQRIVGGDSSSVPGAAAASVEAGLPTLPAALLVRAGLASRRAAEVATADTHASFTDFVGVREWLSTEVVERLSATQDWPTEESAEAWRAFRRQILDGSMGTWNLEHFDLFTERPVTSLGSTSPETLRLLRDPGDGAWWLCTPDFRRLTRLRRRDLPTARALWHAVTTDDPFKVAVQRQGPQRGSFLSA